MQRPLVLPVPSVLWWARRASLATCRPLFRLLLGGSWLGHVPLGVTLMVVLDGSSLTIDSLAAVADGQDEVALAPAARNRMAAAREVVEEALRSEVAVYGL